MNFTDINTLKAEGFTGFKTIEDLRKKENKNIIPKEKGVYLILNLNKTPSFTEIGTGGFFKGKDPNVSEEILRSNWIEDTFVVYIGKAGSETGKATLRSRLNQYFKFGNGKNVGHWGGRYIWQIENPKDLVVCWKTTESEPREAEKSLIQEFKKQFDGLPFANLIS